MLGLVAVELDGAEFGEEVGVFGGEVEEAGFEEDAEVGEEGAARNVAAVGVAAWGDGDGDEFGVEVGADDEFGEGSAGTGGVDEEDLFGGGESVEEVAEDGDEADVFEAEGEALSVLDAESGFGEVDEVSVVEFAGEFEFGFEDDEGGVVAALPEVEADVEVGAVGAQGLSGRSEIHGCASGVRVRIWGSPNGVRMRFARGPLGVRRGFARGSKGVRTEVRTEVQLFRMNELRWFGGQFAIDVEGVKGDRGGDGGGGDGAVEAGDEGVALVLEEGTIAREAAVFEGVEAGTGFALGGFGSGGGPGGCVAWFGNEIGSGCVAHDVSPATKIRRRRSGYRVGGRAKWLISRAQINLKSCQGRLAGWPIRGFEGDRAEWSERAPHTPKEERSRSEWKPSRMQHNLLVHMGHAFPYRTW